MLYHLYAQRGVCAQISIQFHPKPSSTTTWAPRKPDPRVQR
jgi:hypothetical protein